MVSSAGDYTLTYATEQLALTRAALASWRANAGVDQYGIQDRNARINLEALERDERRWMAEIRRIEGTSRRVRSIVPVDIR